MLAGCSENIRVDSVEALAMEGLDPEDPASLAELSSDLLDALHLKDALARQCVLALKCAADDESGAWGGEMPGNEKSGQRLRPSQPIPTDSAYAEESARPKGRRAVGTERLNLGGFVSRVFEQRDRRGSQAQEVVPGLFLGGFKAADNAAEHRRLGITHIVNATSHRLDAPHAKVLCLHLKDCDGNQDISCHFHSVNEFLNEALDAGCAALVHCVRGVSRSTALVCAYIMSRSELDVDQALSLVRQSRPVANPRAGFVSQLKDFRKQQCKTCK